MDAWPHAHDQALAAGSHPVNSQQNGQLLMLKPNMLGESSQGGAAPQDQGWLNGTEAKQPPTPLSSRMASPSTYSSRYQAILKHKSPHPARGGPSQPLKPGELDAADKLDQDMPAASHLEPANGPAQRSYNVPKLDLSRVDIGLTSQSQPGSMPPPQHPVPNSQRATVASVRRATAGSERLGSASTTLSVAASNGGADSWRRLSHVPQAPSLAALERKEQLLKYKAMKADQTKAKPGQAAQDPIKSSRGTSRLSLPGAPRPAAARPPLPTSHAMLPPAAAVHEAARQPLPPDDDGDDQDSPAHGTSPARRKPEPHAHHAASTQHHAPARTTHPAQFTTATAQPPLPKLPNIPLNMSSRLSVGGMSTASSQISMKSLHTPRSMSAAGDGGVSNPAAMLVAANAAATEMRAEIRALKLQELQWRYLNARMQYALDKRRQGGEQALAACALATCHLERSTSVSQALQARLQQHHRLQAVATSLQPLLQQFQRLQSPDVALQHVSQALLNSLTNVPLVCGAICGDMHFTDLSSLEAVMTRGTNALMQIDAALQPLLAACGHEVQGGVQAMTAEADASVPGGSSVLSVGVGTSNTQESQGAGAAGLLPVASILTELVSSIATEVRWLKEVLSLISQLKSKQMQVASCQVQLLQMRRRQQPAEHSR